MYHELLDQGIDPDDHDDPESYITEEGRCSGCGYQLDFDDLKALDFRVEESGVQPGTPDGPAVYWATGYIICPNCHDRLPYETSS